MPFYDFMCDSCGPYEVERPISEATAPAPCPCCRRTGRRVFTPPGTVRTPGGLRHARDLEEKSAHEPDLAPRPRGRPLHLHEHAQRTPPWAVGGC
jgi:putative FmdB family regulatory protein